MLSVATVASYSILPLESWCGGGSGLSSCLISFLPQRTPSVPVINPGTGDLWHGPYHYRYLLSALPYTVRSNKKTNYWSTPRYTGEKKIDNNLRSNLYKLSESIPPLTPSLSVCFLVLVCVWVVKEGSRYWWKNFLMFHLSDIYASPDAMKIMFCVLYST